MEDPLAKEIEEQNGHLVVVIRPDERFQGSCACAWLGEYRDTVEEALIDCKLHLLESV